MRKWYNLNMDFSKLIDWIKLSPKYLFAIALISGVLLFVPTNVLGKLGLIPFVAQYKSFIGVIFLFSTILFLIHPLTEVYDLVQTRITKTREVRNLQNFLHNLTEDEKRVLRGYICERTQSQYLDIQDGVTNGLEVKHIIWRASIMGELNYFAYNIQPSAWKYLNEHPELLSPQKDDEVKQ